MKYCNGNGRAIEFNSIDIRLSTCTFFSTKVISTSIENRMSRNPYIGSSFDDLLEEDGTLEEINLIVIKRVISWQIQEAMHQKKINKTEMAKEMHTSRSSLNRLLDPENVSVTIDTIERATKVVGKRIHIELVDIT